MLYPLHEQFNFGLAEALFNHKNNKGTQPLQKRLLVIHIGVCICTVIES